MENNNKESFKLLDMSASGTDSGSEVPEFVVAPPRKKRVKRRLRGASAIRKRQTTQPCKCQGRTIGLAIARIFLFCWLVTITWLAVVLHGELKRLDNDVRDVVAGNEGVPDALQRCHALSRELQQNQTSLFSHIATLAHQLDDLSAQLSGVQAGLHDIEEKLKAAPELVNLPRDVQSLSTSVASFGSQIRDLNTTVTVLKNENSQLQETSKTLQENVTGLKQRVAQLVNTTQLRQTPPANSNAEKEALLSMMTQLSTNVSLMNDTLSKKLQWQQDDQQNDHKLIEQLRDGSQNVSARLTTLEGDCVKSASHVALNDTVGKLVFQVNKEDKQLSVLDRQVSQLQVQTDQLETNGTLLSIQIRNISFIVHSLQFPETETMQPEGDVFFSNSPSSGDE